MAFFAPASALVLLEQSLGMVLGWRQEDPEVVPGAMGGPQEGLGGGRRDHERFELTFSDGFGPPGALSLRFPTILGPRTLSHYASPKPSLDQPIFCAFLWVLGCGGEPVRRGYKDLIADT